MKTNKRQEESKKREAAWQVNRFVQFTADFDETDIAWLLCFDRLQQQVYICSDEDKAAYYPDDLEWPIVWALARYNKKDIICSKRIPRSISDQ